MPKRALSLDDLVNHDETDKSKLQKLSEEAEAQREEAQTTTQPPVQPSQNGSVEDDKLEPAVVPPQPSQSDQPKRLSNVSDILNNDDEYDYINTRSTSNNAAKSISSDDFNIDSDETDTDDDIGGNGEVNFDSGMTFDYDKQDKNSPQKVSPSPAHVDKKSTKLAIPEESEKKEKEEKKTEAKQELPQPPNPVSSEMKPDLKPESELKETEKETFVPVTKEFSDDDSKPIEKKKPQELKIEEKTAKKESANDDKKPLVSNEKPVESGKPNAAVSHIFEEKASSVSKRNNIKKDLQVLQEIASTSKPNKYKNVPIWAQKWKPTLNALQQIDSNDFKLDPSFLNIIPDDDLTKSVQDWIYATIFSIAPEMRQFIELEMKFGVIRDGATPDRINPAISSQAIYTELDAHMTPNIDEVLFKELNKYIRGIGELTENSGKFNVIESVTKDSLYRVGISTQRPRFLRMSTDVKTGRIGQFIEKRHVAQLLMYSPKDSYDVKISLNLELPVPENDPPEKYQSQIPISIRTKDRVSYIHNDSCTRIDVTKVDNHNKKATKTHMETTYEVELEINTPALLSAFGNITNDSKQYAALIRTFLNNGTIIRRKLTSLSSEIFEGTKK
ncbi:mRNA-capping enzyme subunit beta [Monosporozyma unispora]|nr:mRNA-capping enzyme subunit beta [Kazachstania unispora]